MATELLYMTDPSTTYQGALVESLFFANDNREVLVLNKTIFYPQGGGQPYDQGVIKNANGEFQVEEVRFVEGKVQHIGKFLNGVFNPGDQVDLEVNAERRLLNSKLQSAGHLIDIALRNIGHTEIIPAKGFHFPEGPYVEYVGEISEEDLVAKVQSEIDRMIEAGYETVIKMSTVEEASKVCYFVPPNLPEGKPIRIVAVWDDQFIPCGGTHVANIKDLSGLKVREIKSKSGNTRVSYEFTE